MKGTSEGPLKNGCEGSSSIISTKRTSDREVLEGNAEFGEFFQTPGNVVINFKDGLDGEKRHQSIENESIRPVVLVENWCSMFAFFRLGTIFCRSW